MASVCRRAAEARILVIVARLTRPCAVEGAQHAQHRLVDGRVMVERAAPFGQLSAKRKKGLGNLPHVGSTPQPPWQLRGDACDISV